ncbi:GNAT family N-acetyltransferase [Lysobacter sp. LF1]|uniref:GNAT family N-acetyltransferase n=1 Tax=Lysobacter stagni TaxID=3045172 RepID=A0ABT6XEF0_9GAMM|nr:GNAT family N-acetyltransferase [Lysobacter sp. LF1]MDI9238414.1 GNAT family N-acetyltransferase [Lysobacter sp. LF1]
MTTPLRIRPIERSDLAQWRPLWDGYNAFYGRVGESALAQEITSATWQRFFDDKEPVRAWVAECEGRIVGMVHCVFHRSTSRLHDICYLQDLFTAEDLRGRGVGRQLVLAVYEAARLAGCSRVYWQTQANNSTARALYDTLAEHKGFIVYVHELA